MVEVVVAVVAAIAVVAVVVAGSSSRSSSSSSSSSSSNVGPSYAWGPGLMSSSGANSGSGGMFRDPL